MQSVIAHAATPKLTADAILPAPAAKALARTTDRIVAIGVSTGGTQALQQVLSALPSTSPGLVIVQHMPELFTRGFAQRLDSLCEINVAEAVSGDRILTGHALIAPGGRHLLVKRSGAQYVVDVVDGPLSSGALTQEQLQEALDTQACSPRWCRAGCYLWAMPSHSMPCRSQCSASRMRCSKR